MSMTLLLIVASAALIWIVAVLYRRDGRLESELDTMKTRFMENEKVHQQDNLLSVTNPEGLSESSVLSLIGEIARIENNLYHMQDVPGRKQISKALERMKVTLQAEDYTMVPLLGTVYREGMQASVGFTSDESLPVGSSIIISVQKPQVNRAGRMIQAASVTVGQNI